MAKLNSLSDLKSLFPEAEGTYQPEIKPKKQQLEAHFSNKGRGGKTVTIIKGFDGSPHELKALEKELKSIISSISKVMLKASSNLAIIPICPTESHFGTD